MRYEKVNCTYLKNHILWSDIAKGIAIILVVAGHSYPPAGGICKFIFLFHMPIFFLLAGFFFNYDKYKDNFKQLIITSSKRLLLPQLIILLIFWDNNSLKYIPSFLYAIGKPITNLGIFGVPWFLVCLFLVRIFIWGFVKFTNYLKLSLFFKISLAFIIAYLGTFIGGKIYLPWSFDIAMVALYISYIGFLIKEYKFFDCKKIYHIIFAIIFIILGIIDYKYFGLSMNERQYSNPIISINAGIGLSILVLYMSIILEKLDNYKTIKYFNIFMQYLGVNTIIIYLVHLFAHSSFSSTVCTFFRIAVSIIFIEILALIPDINKIFSAKSIRNWFCQKTSIFAGK